MRVGTHKMLCSGSKKTGGRSDVLEMAHSRGRLTSRFLVYVIRTRTSSQGFACHSRVGGNLEVFENVTFLDSRLRGNDGFHAFFDSLVKGHRMGVECTIVKHNMS